MVLTRSAKGGQTAPRHYRDAGLPADEESVESVASTGVTRDPTTTESPSLDTATHFAGVTRDPTSTGSPSHNAAPSTEHLSGTQLDRSPLAEKPTPVGSTPADNTAATNDDASTGTVVPTTAPVRRAPHSTTTTRTKRQKAILRAREDAATAEADAAIADAVALRAKAAASRARIARLEAEEESDISSELYEDHAAQTQRVDTWLDEHQTQLIAIAGKSSTEERGKSSTQPPPIPQPPPLTDRPHTERALPQPTLQTCVCVPASKEIAATSAGAAAPPPTPNSNFTELAAAIVAASRSTKPSLPHRYYIELPPFYGSHQDWLSFRAAYNETAASFTDVENTARLRRNLRGKAKEAVENLLLHYTEPKEIMRTLESRFGRPEAIAAAELERLRALPKLTDNPRDICVFANKVSNVVAALNALDRVYYMYNPEITTATSEKLPPTLRHRWFDYAASQPAGEPDLMKMAKFLQREADLCSPYAQPEPTTTPKEDASHGHRRQNIQRAYATQTSGEKTCATCKGVGHDVPACPEFKKAEVNERWDLAKNGRLCFKCLRIRKRIHTCKTRRCGIDGCSYPHHHLLHQMDTEQKPDDRSETVASTWTSHVPAAYLKMAPVTVTGPAGEVKAWALLDDGSTVSLIDTELANQVGAEGPIDPLFINAIGNKKIDSSHSRRVSLTLSGRDSQPQQLQLRTIDGLRLTPQQVRQQDLKGCHHLQNLRSLLPVDIARPKILIGQDNWPLLLATETRRGRRDQPVASLTPLGWVLHGTHTRALGHQVNFVAHLTEATPEKNMEEDLRRYFALESLTVVAKNPQSDPDQRALDILTKTTRQLPDAHYETALLWKEENAKMPNNYEAALNRLKLTEKKIHRNPTMAQKYKTEMQALLDKGYAERAPTARTPDKTWYLPHFGVTNPTKPEKLRIVHDAAAKTRGRSLNDYLLTGPDQLQSLPGVLMRFRQHAVAVTADITEMFMQINIRQEDRDALRYLWRDDTKQPPTEFRMKSVIFGATSSPATAIFVKNLNAEKHRQNYPEAADAIIKNHYMDDYLGSYRTTQDAARVASHVRDIHRKGHFQLRKWNSNCDKVRRLLTDEEPPTDVTLTAGAASERVLGLIWKPDDDTLGFNLDMARVPQDVLQSDSPTKRQALRIVMSIYDPLGIASPVTIQGKQMLQELWRRGTAWDAHIDNDLAKQWRDWMKHLQRLRDVSVPRPYTGYSDAVSLQLHTFVDASESAYAAALYWRAVMPDGEVRLSLVLGKARVAPLKLSSIPRLELQAAVMGSRMAAAATEEHERKPDTRVFWTDSMTALTWLRTGSRSYRPFVAHRIAAVEENSTLSEWRWVPTKLNVADDATRDVPADFDSRHRWYTGPEFLRAPEETWPTQKKVMCIDNTGEEKCNTLTTARACIKEAIPDAERFSRWERYVRATARVLQFIELCRRKRERTHYKRTRANQLRDPTWTTYNKKNSKTTTPRFDLNEKQSPPLLELDGDTLRRAETLIWRNSQGEVFTNEIETLQSGKPITPASRLHKLSVHYTDGLIRLNSRINHITGADDLVTSPAVLDGNRHEMKLLIDYIHRRMNHAGAEATLSEVRQSYWVLRLRPVTKMVIHRCLPCRIRKDAPPRPSTGNHPPSRLAHHQRPFTYSGLDFFGPYLICTGRSTQKHYVALFTCLTTRAVHLEPTASLSADSAIMALRRMIARRGTPTEIWSDNGTNLRGADKELRRALDRATEKEASRHLISWRFIPPGSPFMGGAWERMVRAVKSALAATQQPRHPTVEVFHTLLAEAEFTVNSRPLTHVSVSADDPAPLTPNHFLLGGPARVPAPGTFSDADLIGRTHWRAAQRLADIFWSRWLREYLPDLQHRREPHCRGPAVMPGDVVIVADGTLPRNTWPRGVIEAIYPGTDNITRVVDVRTTGGILRRPVKKLIALPTTPAAHQEDCSALDDAARRENVRDGQT